MHMKRHAYLILAHTNPGQLRKLLMLLDDPRNDIFVHIDRKAGFDGRALDGACSSSRVEVLNNRISVRWGGVSIMKCELALLREATRTGQYDYYHLLSGMDLPIKDQDTIHRFFDANRGKEFIDFWEMRPDILDRAQWYTPFPEMERNFLFHAINKGCRNIQKALGRRINTDIGIEYGSQWFSITDGMARYVTYRESELEEIFGHTIICDEFFMSTAVWGSPFRQNIYEPSHDRNVCGNMRLIDWSRGGNIRHPWTFRIDDMDMLMSSPMLWARKFDERADNDIIDTICHRLKPEIFHDTGKAGTGNRSRNIQ